MITPHDTRPPAADHATVEREIKALMQSRFPGMKLEIVGGSSFHRRLGGQKVSPIELDRKLVEQLFPEGEFREAKRGIAMLLVADWRTEYVEGFRAEVKKMLAIQEETRREIETGMKENVQQAAQIKDLQSELRQAVELRGVHADKAKEALEKKVANLERLLADEQAAHARARDHLRQRAAEITTHEQKAIGLERCVTELTTAAAGNAALAQEADAFLAGAVDKITERWGEAARGSPFAALILADVMRARGKISPPTLATAQSATA